MTLNSKKAGQGLGVWSLNKFDWFHLTGVPWVGVVCVPAWGCNYMPFDQSRMWSDIFYIHMVNDRYSLKWSVPSTSHGGMLVCTHLRSQVSGSKYQGVAASLWPVAAVEGAQTLNICIKKTYNEYEACGGPQSKELTETHLLYQQHPLSGLREQISGCGGILMTGSHCSRCWST